MSLVKIVAVVVYDCEVEPGILAVLLACERQVHEQVLGCALVA